MVLPNYNKENQAILKYLETRSEEIINRIKEGEELFISCSMYEITIWYENGIFKSTFENGYQCILDEKLKSLSLQEL